MVKLNFRAGKPFIPIPATLQKWVRFANENIFNSLFRKFITVFIVLLLVSFLITGVILYAFLGNFTLSEREKVISYDLDQVQKFLTLNGEDLGDAMVLRTLRQILDAYSEHAQSLVFVVNTEGYVIFVGQPKNIGIARKGGELDAIFTKITDANGKLRLPDPKQYIKMMQGGESQIREVGDFFGLFRDNQIRSWLVLARPLTFNTTNGSSDRIVGGIYFMSPVPNMSQTRMDIFKLFMISVSISILLAMLMVYSLSRRITRPLYQINLAAKVISKGDFRQKIEIVSNDELGELAKSFNQMVDALKQLEDMRRGFIANVSHELRTPMTSIGGFVEGILDGTIPRERQNDYLNIVRDETKRLNRLVNDLLDLAKMEAGEIVITPIRFNIHELIRRCIIKLENPITQKNLSLDARFYEEELYVVADSDAIERVVLNLLHNAVKFTPEDGKIEIITDAQKNKVFVTIRDHGIGIDEAELDRIWERFYKADKSRGKDKTGTGLGLAIVRNIILEHHENIFVKSVIGQGTEFSFTLAKSAE